MENLWNKLIEWGASAGLKLIGAVLILIIGFKLVNLFCGKILRNPKVQVRDASLAGFLNNFLSIILKALVVITAALVIGIPSASFLALLGSAGVAVGLALQGSLGNLAGGIMILSFRLFKVGDFIETASGMGTVRSINAFYTVLSTPDNRQLTIPNSALTNATVTNYSVEKSRRVDFVFNTDYGCDIDLVKSVLTRVAKDDPRVLFDPAPIVFMSGHRDSALEFTMRVWCEREFYWELNYVMRENVKRAFDAAGIQIPFNQLDVHVVDAPDKTRAE